MGTVKVFRNCYLLRDHEIVNEDLWVKDGTIIDPEKLFFDELRNFDEEIDCKGCLIAPGFIDWQINGGFGVDFTFDIKDQATAEECLGKVGKGLLSHGRFCRCPRFCIQVTRINFRISLTLICSDRCHFLLSNHGDISERNLCQSLALAGSQSWRT